MRRTAAARIAAVGVPAAFLALFFLYPLGAILERGLTQAGGLRFPGDVLFSHDTVEIAWFTVWQATVSTVLTVLAGMPLAWATARLRFRGRRLVRALVVVPFVLPTVVVATAFLALLPSRFDRGVVPILLAHVFFNVAVVVRVVGGYWARLDPRLWDAAAILGASPLRRFRELTLPALRPALAAAAALTFLFCFTSFGVVLILGGIILSLIAGAWPAIKAYGLSFLFASRWAPSAEPPVLGALGPIYGTLVTSAIAMLIAIPVGLGIAIFLTELCPQWLRRPIGIAVELLAGIPSIIYGMWGFFVLGPFMADTFQPFMIRLFDGVPVLGSIFAGPPSYLSLFNAALILAIMVLPFITSISVDVFKTVPPVLKEAAYGIGCTTWEVVRNVVIPYTRVGVIGGIMLALGRALGETMAVTFIIGNSFRISPSVFAPGTTISAAIASEFAESDGLHQSGLILLGLLLFVLTFFVLASARLMLMRLKKKAGD